ncbi:MAG: cation:proton antiporter [Clostridia bacterium]|nr:cation:proton antiporter [Clostridia bacterium]
MESYRFLLVLGIILLSTKVLGLLSERVHMPQVVGALLAGILLGPSVLGMVSETDFLTKTSEIGVIILMFSAGLDTELKELRKTGIASFIIALIGVIVPLVGGYACYEVFFGSGVDPERVLKGLFIGVVLTATSVSITVETLREMGRLHGKVGTAILGAAVIDDVLGLIALTVLSAFTDESVRIHVVLGRIGLFFLFVGIVGFVAHKIFARMDMAWGEKRRVAIGGLVFCLFMSYLSEVLFGIADITGAYFAGLILCNIMRTRSYIAKKLTVISYMFFSPVFFASIGIKTELTGMSGKLFVFSVVLLVVAILTKILGCGLGAKACGFRMHEALSVGVGMVSRGEVALIVAQKGAQAGLVDEHMFPAIVLVVIVTTLITPILLKLVMRHDPPQPATQT